MIRRFILLATLLLSFCSYSQVETVITTAASLNIIKGELNELVNKSLDRADFTIAKAAIEMLGIIDAWEVANSNLLDKAFSGIETSSRDLFARASSLIDKASDAPKEVLKTAEEISNTALQIGENLPFSDKRTYILRYSPRIISPLVSDKVLIKLTGVNLDKADAKIILPDNSIAISQIVGPQEINFWLPLSSVPSESVNSKIYEIKITHNTRDGGNFFGLFPKYKNVVRTIFISTLPSQFARYELTGAREFKTEEIIMHTTDCGKFEGTNTEIQKIAAPPSGYKWDLRNGVDSRHNFKVETTGGGEKGNCHDYVTWNGSNENGIIISARVDRIKHMRKLKIKYTDGYTHCGLKGPIYRFLDSKEKIKSQNGKLEWNKDHSINLEKDVTDFELKIIFPNSEEKIVTNNFEHKMFSVIKESNKLIIRPKIPNSLVN